jgi:hypothetical protein
VALLACTRSVRERLTFCDSGFLPFSVDPRTIGSSNAPFLSLTAGSLKSYSGIQLRLRQRRLGHHPRPFCWPGCGQHVAQTCPPPSAPRRRGRVPTSHPVSPHPVSRGLHAVAIDGGELEETFMGLSARCAHLFSESRLTRRDTGTKANPELDPVS